MTDVKLPAIIANTLPALDQLTTALGVPRDILASAGEIETAWNNLPGVLKKIPPALRTEGMARMCVAVASGLFDSGVMGSGSWGPGSWGRSWGQVFDL